MKTESRTKKLVDAFNSEKVLNLDAVKEILGTASRMTVFRKLKDLGYYSSYSHCGKYYTLCLIPQFDKNSLWNYGGVHFSRHGSLIETIPVFVKRSGAGYFASELEELLHVFVHNALGKLCVSGRLMREQIGEQYLYLSPALAESQILAREKMLTYGVAQSALPVRVTEEQAGEHLKTLLSVLDEKQRRLFPGFESVSKLEITFCVFLPLKGVLKRAAENNFVNALIPLKGVLKRVPFIGVRFGHGGDVRMALVSGVKVKTVSRGRKELLAKEIDLDRVRRKGAGRPPLKKTKS